MKVSRGPFFFTSIAAYDPRLVTMAEPGAPNGYLDPSQGNALVYSTLCGFMLIGLWAGYNTRSKREFISGVRTQSGT